MSGGYPKTFKDLFKPEYKEHSERFKQILRDVTPELISGEDIWLIHKNMARFFYDRMVFHKIMIAFPHAHVATVFENEFSGIKASTFKDKLDDSKAMSYYNADLNERILLIKSQLIIM